MTITPDTIAKKSPSRTALQESIQSIGFSQQGYRAQVKIFKQYLNKVIRKKVIEQLGKKKLLMGKKIVIKVDDHCLYLLGELDSWEQLLEVKEALQHLRPGRKILNRLTVRPKSGLYQFQKNLL